MYFDSRIASKIELSTPKKHPRFRVKTAIPSQKINPSSLPPASTNPKINKITNLQRSRKGKAGPEAAPSSQEVTGLLEDHGIMFLAGSKKVHFEKWMLAS